MLKEFENPEVVMVGTTFAGKTPDGTPVSLGNSYNNPRNTGLLIRTALFDEHLFRSGWDPYTDKIGGQEDYHMKLTIEIFTSLQMVMLDLKVPLIVGVNYDQTKKERDEQLAMQKINDRMKGWSTQIRLMFGMIEFPKS
ncbi:MAG: hypothetical protein G01um101418_664 [Parcubacteria group bacterium Gr01-1014_18]|nr:MAG: hypothetical protein Greene041636_625 [Parcubacteria group bacterium Greene0416_36]TSC80745.1 MAG: hypothetical protein G01um101418_664 [Parcubacteria group bacterium Gr01-1014_18]TSC98644.1 MAG: hypothetical protein Greene101420_603 [Parcubacteria group bacterium Greene1014_20]